MAANGGANTHHPAQRPRDKAQLTPKPTLVPPPATPQTARKGRLNFLYSKPERFAEILLACECDARGRLGFEEAAYPQRQRLAAVLQAAQSVVTRDIAARAAAQGITGPQVGKLIHQARVDAVAHWLREAAAE